MVTVQIKGATPRQTGTLCRTCRFGHMIRRFSTSQEYNFCRVFYPERRISFAVFECSEYEDKRLASKKEMEEIAWFLTTRKSGRGVGFVSAVRFHELELKETSSSAASKEKKDSTE
jgi:hypothetical protein